MFGLIKLHKVGDVKHNLYIINKLKLKKLANILPFHTRKPISISHCS